MKMLLFGFWMSTCLSLNAYQIHDFYISVCQIDVNEASQSLELTLKIFTDDLEETMKNNGAGQLNIGLPEESASTEKLLAEYLLKNIRIHLDGKKMSARFLGKENEANVTWIYIEVPNVSNFKSLRIKNTVLMDSFDKQTNLINVIKKKVKKSLILNTEKKEGSVSF